MTKRKMYIRMITASLIRRRSRMLVALLAIMIGAAILSGLVTIYYDVPRQMGAQFRSYGANMLFTATNDNFTKEDVEAAKAVIASSELVGLAPYRYETVRINDRPILAAGTDMEGAQKTSPFWAVSGTWPSSTEEIMVGKVVAQTFNLHTGDRVTLSYAPETAKAGESGKGDTDSTASAEDEYVLDNTKDFKVTGVLDTGGNEEEYVYISLDDMEELVGGESHLDACELSVSATGDKLSKYESAINEAVPALQARLVKRVTQSEDTVLSKLQALVLLVTIVVLALTMICVATTMTAVVAERRKEIGLRKALGATDKSIIGEFMGEGLLLGGVGGLLGAILGFIFAQMVSMNVFNSSISFRFLLLPITIIVSIFVTGLASLIPIKSATNVDPALVLKGE
ncbi:MAG: ABC transporter permease [Lachnospiraceae bacterium]|nr:ABC transporter permease [Lachnospiraceae bacterium]